MWAHMAGLIKLNYMEIESHGDGSGWEFDGSFQEKGCGPGGPFGRDVCERHTFNQYNSGEGYIECSDGGPMRNGIAYGSGDGAYCILKIN